MASDKPLIIVGGGLAGSLAALALAEQQPQLPVLLLESGDCFGGNHTWSFFDSDIPAGAAALVAALNPVRWPRHRVIFPERARQLDMAYNSVSSQALDALVRARLAPEAWQVNTAVAELLPDAVILASGERLEACGVIDARGPDAAMPGLVLGWQKFVGIEYAARADDPECATVMDATIPQLDGYRFVYVLPLGADRVLVEDTYYSNGPELDVPVVAARVKALAAQSGLIGPELRREIGILPILIGGDPETFWPAADPIARLGLRGGFFQPTTGYSFSMALRMAAQIGALGGAYDSAALARWSRGAFMAHWRAGRYFRLLNRMLFHAAAPDQRYRIFSHFYRLPQDLIARFYAGTLRATDKVRILSGTPPVPIGAAMAALVKRLK